jgi:hypothetical protein
MRQFTLRVDDELIAEFDALAKIHQLSRSAFIIRLMKEAVDIGYIPIREGDGFRGTTDEGGEITLMRHNKYVSGGKHNLSNNQIDAYEQAKQIASPDRGSQWVEARRILEEAGFKVTRL